MKLRAQLTIENKLGLHARAAIKLVELAAKYDSEVLFITDKKQASAASVLGLLLLERSQGEQITVQCEGPDAEQAFAAIKALIEARFDEQE
ncbi:HPr family phosphocarrier protein [Celerinatantimonas sp. MCCC 1A17872]|uniref:HPr family phosphocarrier protein n=1 Tax=Celerinatantimonas sp. MCCC 1A17872 TaxID=3177514 RepID=UPI0038C1EEFF